MKGIVLAGGTGSRLWPITTSVSKQLLPIYDKPMVFYPISTLMLAGIRQILIITTPTDQAAFKKILGDGSQFGVEFSYEEQEAPEGLAQAFTIGKQFLKGEDCVLILGDNIFHGAGLGNNLQHEFPTSGAHIFTYEVANPSQYGVLEIDSTGNLVGIEEKPLNPRSNLAVTGLYYFDSEVTDVVANIQKSSRGEYEITSIIDWYLKENKLTYTKLGRGTAWLDTGTPEAMHEASSYVRIIEDRTGLKIACLEEIAYKNNWIDELRLQKTIERYGNNSYGRYLRAISQL